MSDALHAGEGVLGWAHTVEKRFSPHSRIARRSGAVAQWRSGAGRAKREGLATLISRIDRCVRFCVRRGVKAISVAQARSRLYELLDLTAASHEPIQLTGKRSNAVPVGLEGFEPPTKGL